jgi:hypothetical protein
VFFLIPLGQVLGHFLRIDHSTFFHAHVDSSFIIKMSSIIELVKHY